MIRLALKSALARKARLLSTASAVVLGVAFLTGTLVFILSADISQYVPVVDIRGRCLLLAVKMCLSVLLQKNVVRRVGRAETERLNRWILHDIRMPVRFYVSAVKEPRG